MGQGRLSAKSGAWQSLKMSSLEGGEGRVFQAESIAYAKTECESLWYFGSCKKFSMARELVEMKEFWKMSVEMGMGQVRKGLLCHAEVIRLHTEGDWQPPKSFNTI